MQDTSHLATYVLTSEGVCCRIMTDTSSLAVTPSTADPYPVTVPLLSPAVSGVVSDSAVPEDEEPYTIKCICAFTDDDGNTVFCEKCETWQHIECYYHGRSVPDVHNCVDCEPRPVDARRATERQIRLREQGDGSDRKAKRSGAKSQRKKARDSHDQANGFHRRSESSTREQPPPKKAKTSHRASASVSSLPGTMSVPDTRKRSTHLQSPVKSSGPSIPLYSSEFLHRYEQDQGHADMDSNLFVSLPLAADLASWVTDANALSRVSHGRPAREIFTWSDAALDRSRWPTLSTELITDPDIDIDGRHPTWKILKTQDAVRKDDIVGEVKGKIGLLRDYCLDPSNRWQELRHPEPYVFFHPQLPIYIDSRQEGTLLRYVRRSCRPNVTMKTYITNEVEYHFCFVAKEDIPANSEITAMWYLDPQLFESANGLVKEDSNDSAQDVAAICLSNVLAHFGGCACVSDPPQNCLLSSIDRRRHPKIVDVGFKQVNGKKKKTRSKSTNSPVGFGRTAHGRDGSEGAKNVYDDDQAESRSASGSTQGRSRDLTPTLQNANDLILGDSELSARDKRKIAAAEKKFRQLEQDQLAMQRKKKRGSHQSAQTTPITGSSTQTSYFGNHGASSKSIYIDTVSGHHKSRSPPSAVSPTSTSAARRASRKTSASSAPSMPVPLGLRRYVDSATQTDLDENDPSFVAPAPPRNRPVFASLTQRLLKRCHEDRVKIQDLQLQKKLDSGLPNGRGVHHPASPGALDQKEDVEMTDATSPEASQPQSSGSGIGDTVEPASGIFGSKPPLPPPWPSTAAHNARIPGAGANRHTDFRIPLPLSTAPIPSSAPSTETVTPTVVQSLQSADASSQPGSQGSGSTLAGPSPVKKKLSLGDYIQKRSLATPSSEKPQFPANAMPPPQKLPSHSQLNNSSPSSANIPRTEIKPGEANSTKLGGSVSQDVPMKDAHEPTHPSHVTSVSS